MFTPVPFWEKFRFMFTSVVNVFVAPMPIQARARGLNVSGHWDKSNLSNNVLWIAL